MDQGYWFKSDLFLIQEGEDEEVNPGIYGKSLGEWLCKKFSELGYKTDLLPEDWGWCVMCHSDQYLLWVGCGSVMDEEIVPNETPDPCNIIWHVFPEIEVSVFTPVSYLKNLFGMFDTKTPFNKLQSELDNILNAEPGITLCEEPW